MNMLHTLPSAIALIFFSQQAAPASYYIFSQNSVTNSGRIMTPSQAVRVATKSYVITCTEPYSAILSSTPDGLGKVLIDNFLTVNGTNVCPGGPNASANCFSGSGNTSVNPINIARFLSKGKSMVTFDIMDWGSVWQNSNIYLVTSNCVIYSRETICHNPGTDNRPISVTQSVLVDLLGRGDRLGACP